MVQALTSASKKAVILQESLLILAKQGQRQTPNQGLQKQQEKRQEKVAFLRFFNTR
jgi:hypothetical protein